MKSIFPEPIKNLPNADIHLKGLTTYLSQAKNHQILFMEFDEDIDLAEHAHGAQVGIVLSGKINLIIAGSKHTFEKGNIYHIPAGTKHSGKIYAGYADITFFDEPDRYQARS